MKIYLSGASKNIRAEDSLSWREKTQQMFDINSGRVECFIPDKHYNYDDLLPESDRACKNLFLNKLRNSDLLIVNLNDSSTSVGTGIEVALAHELHIPVIGFGKENAYPWTCEFCDVILDNLTLAVNYILEHYV